LAGKQSGGQKLEGSPEGEQSSLRGKFEGRKIFARLPKRNPAALLGKSRSQQKSFLFLLKEKTRRAQEKSRENFFAGWRARASGGGAEQSKFKVRIFVKKSSDFVQKVPPIFKIRFLGDCCLALATLGLGFRRDFEGKFEIQKQFLPAQTEVRRAKHG